MKKKELLNKINEGESSTLEFKRKISSNDKIAKEIAAFANTKGGLLLIGVDDDGTVVGVDSEKGTIGQIEQICAFHIKPEINPAIEIIQVNRYDVIAVFIQESLIKPHTVVDEEIDHENKQKAYIRVGDKSIAASREMKRFLASQNVNTKELLISIGDKEKRLFAYLENNERATVKDFAKLVNISDRRAERLLIRLVRAGVLMIHADSRDYFTLV
jgi:predicted HTH transcriptional regulator